MPIAPWATPRKMFPPPMTTAICTPRSETSFTSRTMRSTVSRLMPKESSPINASPDIFRRMRWYAGAAGGLGSLKRLPGSGGVLRHRGDFGREVVHFLLDALAHHHQAVAHQLRVLRLQPLLDGLLVVLHERLAHDRVLGEYFVDPALD